LQHWQNPLLLNPRRCPSGRVWMQIIGVTVCASLSLHAQRYSAIME
jgi:hypothetical protein